MISSGELYLLSSRTGGEFQPLPQFLNQNIRVIAACFGCAYVSCEPAVCPSDQLKRPSTVWCFEGDAEPRLCGEFEAIEEDIKQIAVGEKHLLVLTHTGVVYSRGVAVYGNAGHGGARDVLDFKPVPALKNRNVKFVAAGPHFSIAITHEGDVFSWGQAFNGETGLLSQVDTVPRFAHAVTLFRVTEVSCGSAHVLARTEMQQCIAWGENTSGQLGVGCKSKPTYKPQLIDAIPSEVLTISAGWAHSAAVGVDFRAYTWGLNSHGQLGLGDTKTRFAPHLVHVLVGVHEVESVHTSRVTTIFRVRDSRPLLCGRIPSGTNANDPLSHPRRPGESDPAGCLLCPVPILLAGGSGAGRSQLTRLAAFEHGVIGFAQSCVYLVQPNLAPLFGGTQIRAFVTGLPYERPGKSISRLSDASAFNATYGSRALGSRPATGNMLLQDQVPVKVRLRSSSPLCEFVVPGKIVDADTVEFTTPDVELSPLGSVAEQAGCASVQLQVSIDDGFTWTGLPSASTPRLDIVGATNRAPRRSDRKIFAGLQDLKDDFETTRRTRVAADAESTLLWYCRWPRENGPSHAEPSCAPVTGGTELLLHIQLAPRMPTGSLTVKFKCKPLRSIDDSELEARAPMRRDAAEIVNPDLNEVAKLPLVGPLDVLTSGWLDPGGRGVRCISPPLDAESVKFFEYYVELSLDGRQFLGRALPFSVYDLRVIGLMPNLGPLLEPTEVRLKTTGLVKTDVQRVRIDFPKDLRWPSRNLPARYDHRNGEIVFTMPELSAEVRRCIEDQRMGSSASKPDLVGGSRSGEPGSKDGGEASGGVGGSEGASRASPELGESTEEAASSDNSGGLAGLEVFVELSLNGQSYTEDRINFTYYGEFEPRAVRVVAPPEGMVSEAPKDDPKAAKGKKGMEEVVEPMLVHPGSKLACEVRGIKRTEHGALRAELFTKVGEDEPKLFKTVELAAFVDLVSPLPPASGLTDDDVKKVKAKEAAPPVEEDALTPIDMLCAYAPFVRSEDIPEGATLYMQNFLAALDGQHFQPCGSEPTRWRLEPKPLEPVLPQDGEQPPA